MGKKEAVSEPMGESKVPEKLPDRLAATASEILWASLAVFYPTEYDTWTIVMGYTLSGIIEWSRFAGPGLVMIIFFLFLSNGNYGW